MERLQSLFLELKKFLANLFFIVLSGFRPTGRISPKNAIGLYYFFSWLKYPNKLINCTISRFISTKVSD